MSHSRNCGCAEYLSLSRRQFMGVSGATIAALSAPAWLPRVVYAGGGGMRTDRDIIVHIYMRGGVDGLSLCVPHFEDRYYELRPTIAIPRPDSNDPAHAIDLDGRFGFPQAMAPLMDAYQAGHLLVVHATGLTDDTRSHFDAQRFMEVGEANNPNLASGWLARHLLSSDPIDPEAVVRAVGINYGLQQVLVGGPLTVPIGDPANYNIGGDPTTLAQRSDTIDRMHHYTREPLRTSAANVLQTMNLLASIDFANYKPYGEAAYPETYFGYAMKSAAALIKADTGVEAIAVDIGGWDTHATEQPKDGYMYYLMDELARGLGAFHLDVIGGGIPNVTIVCMSEFGRNVPENGSQGTDHGHGNSILAIGPNIAGGRVLTDWPGLAPEQLYQGQDLDITIDYRDIVAELVERRLGNTNLDYVFPHYTPTFRGVTR